MKPRIVTLIYKRAPECSGVHMLLGEGSKNYRSNCINEEGWESKHSYTSEKENYILIEGEHRDLIAALKQAKAEYETASEDYRKETERALWEFKDRYLKDHPKPVWPDLNEMVAQHMALDG
jgi:hypothetical protein